MKASERNLNTEVCDVPGRQYAYRFDFEVMHPMMLRTFKPYFRDGSALELGSFRGDFTQHILPFFRDITCVEGSEDSIRVAQDRLPPNISFVHGKLETVILPKRYDCIFLCHVLEHMEDPVALLKRVKQDWLTEHGRLFLVCPNANAPSRQIAVKMGLISHNTAITAAEFAHGHRITYCLDTLERDARQAGLHTLLRTGIFFKAFANFQWDLLLGTPIVSKEYLEGCYQLGQQYPDLCSSIFLLCERGEA